MWKHVEDSKGKAYKHNTNKTPIRRSDGVEFTSITKAAKVMISEGRTTSTNLDTVKKAIKSCLKSKTPTAYGFNWTNI